MNGAEFWALIEESARQTTDRETRTEWLITRLSQRPIPDLMDFHCLRAEAAARSMTWLMWGAAERILGFCSDDSFTDFRCWLIGLGRPAFDRLCADPDALAELPQIARLSGRPRDDWAAEEWPAWEELSYATRRAYHRSVVDGDFFTALHKHPRSASAEDSTLADERWDFDSAAQATRRLPRLTQLFPETERQRRRRLEREESAGRSDPEFFFGNG